MKFAWIILPLLAVGCTTYNSNETALVSIQIHDRNGLTETISAPDRLETFEQLDFLATQPFKKVLRVYKQNGKHSGKITTYHPNGYPWQYLETEELRASGMFKEWYPNGQQKVEAHVIGGTADITPGAQQDWLFEGLAVIRDDKGRLIAEIPYEKGVLEGKSLYYHPNGQLQKECPYHKNELDGTVLEFLSTGELKSKTTYQQGKKEGESIGFWSEQQYAWKENYHEGLLSDAEYYAEDGTLISQVKYSQGFQAIFEDNHLDKLVEIRKGRSEGAVKRFTSEGELKGIYQVKQGKKHGEEIEYFVSSELDPEVPSPTPLISIPWVEDTITGIVKTWYANGKLQSQRELSRNKKTGPSFAWYKSGGLMYMEEYEEDRLLKGTYYKKNQKDPVSTVANGQGIATIFDEEGAFIRKVHYSKGKAVDPEN